MESTLHAEGSAARRDVTDGFSIEITARDAESFRAAAPSIPQGTIVSVTYLENQTDADRLDVVKLVRALGFEPMPHFSARLLASQEAFRDYLRAVVEEAGVTHCFVIAGDVPEPKGPYADSSALIDTGFFEEMGVKVVGIAGHPDGHDHMDEETRWSVIRAKCDNIARRGMQAQIVTQFAFDADRVVDWVNEARDRGIDVPIHLGVPGPAGIKTLLRFAARCGVSASAGVLLKYGVSITQLFGSAGPDKMVDRLGEGLGAEQGAVFLHFYPFGGIEKTVDWINDYADAE